MSDKLDKIHKVIAFALKDILSDEEQLSNCCTAPFTQPGWPDSDFCSQCHEHSGIDEDNDVEAKTIGVENEENY